MIDFRDAMADESIYWNLLQYNLDGSNTDGSFTVDDSNSFFSPYKFFQ